MGGIEEMGNRRERTIRESFRKKGVEHQGQRGSKTTELDMAGWWVALAANIILGRQKNAEGAARKTARAQN